MNFISSLTIKIVIIFNFLEKIRYFVSFFQKETKTGDEKGGELMTKAIILVMAILLVVSVSIQLLEKSFSKTVYIELKERVTFWWGMTIVFGLTMWIHPYISLFTLAFLSFFALREFFSLVDVSPKERRLFLWAYLAIPVQFYWILTDWYGMFLIFIPVHIFLIMPLIRLLSLQDTKGFLKSVASTHWGLMLMVFGLSHLAYFSIMQPEHGPYLILYLVLCTQFADIIQFLSSKWFGKRAVVKEANDSITYEGMGVSFVSTIILSILIAPILLPMDSYFAVVSGALIAFASFVGSLNVSCVKRDLQTNKNGTYVPHKESFLGRIDTLSYTAPLFFHFIRYFFEWM